MLVKIFDKINRMSQSTRRSALCLEVERAVPGFEAYIDHLTHGQAVGTSSHPWRALDIISVLEKTRPLKIVELGSGSSTAIFANYVRTTQGASLVSLDESEEWADLTLQGLRQTSLWPEAGVEIRSAARVEDDLGSFYAEALPADIDLLYIDGPSVKRTGTTQLPNQDVFHLFSRGHYPRTILIDRRYATVQAIRNHPAGARYRYTPSTKQMTKGPIDDLRDLRYFGALNFHSLFRLRS